MSIANKTHTNISHVDFLLKQIKESFLDGLNERCDELELLVLSLGESSGVQDNYDELYRKIHSLKGSGGTNGVPVISTICHHFEDQMNILDGNLERANENFIGICLSYVDLLRQTVTIAKEEFQDFTTVENELACIRQDLVGNNITVLIVESSAVMSAMCRDALADFPIQVKQIDDGLKALEILLHEKFDIVIVSKVLKSLNGVALISALKASESVSRDICTVMLTSTSNIQFPVGCKPNYLIQRDSKMVDSLTTVARKIIDEGRLK